MIASIQINEENNTHRNENTKSDKNTSQGMGSGITPKQLK